MKLKNVVVGSKIEAKTDDNLHGEFIKGDLVKVIYKEPDSYRGELTIRVELDSGETSWQSHKDFRKPRVVAPKLKKLDQSIFDGVDNRYSYFAIDKDGMGGFYDQKPELCGDFFSSGRGWCQVGQYDASDWKNSLIKRESKELTGEALVMAMLKNGKDKILVRVSSSVDTPLDNMIPTFAKKDGDKVVTNNGNTWEKVIAIDIDGNPLTAKDVGL